jgi:WD40 repeat protein
MGVTNQSYALAVGVRQGRPVIVSGTGMSTVQVWDLESGEPALGPLTGHDGRVKAVAVGVWQGQPVIVSGSDDRTVRVWDLDSGEPVLGPLTGHDGGVKAVAVGVRQGQPVIVSGSDDRTVRVWDLEKEGHATLRMELKHPVLSVSSTANAWVRQLG